MPDHPTFTHLPGDDQAHTHSVADSAASTGGEGSSTSTSPQPMSAGRYELREEIAHGGMGVIYRTYDTVLDREVAVKVLHEKFGSASAAARRFVDEARITGQLQHPAIPPVHDLGTLPDGRPFLALKLIKGETLEDQLADRPNPSHGRSRFIAVFEQVCQALAYAHDRQVIHRDLKPANVMVGPFGEVQVMDWGLAKVLGNRPVGTVVDPDETFGGTEIRSTRDSDGSETQAGSVLGTPAFMPPEQAVGAIGKIDKRSDVFGLGAILAVILTGQPPYAGSAEETTRVLAARGKVDGCFDRLDACGADPEWVSLCKLCLAPEPAERPGDAGEVAGAVANLRAAADERVRRAELDRVKAEGERATVEARAEEENKTRRVADEKAVEQRKRRRVQFALAAAVGLLLLGGGAASWWQNQQATIRQIERDKEEANRKAEQVMLEAERRITQEGVSSALRLSAELRRKYRFQEAAKALDQATLLASRGGADDLLPSVKQAGEDLALVRELDDIRMRKFILVPVSKTDTPSVQPPYKFDTASAPKAYRAALLARGYDFEAAIPANLAAHLTASSTRRELVDALDDWAVYEPDPHLANRILETTRRADPGPWLDRFRDQAIREDKARLEQFAQETDPAAVPAAAAATLAALMERKGSDPSRLLLAAQSAHPAEFPVVFGLGVWFTGRDPRQAVGHLRAARTIRPDNPVVLTSLGHLLILEQDDTSAAATFRESIRLTPGAEAAYRGLVYLLTARGDEDGAVAVWREAVTSNPTEQWAYFNLASAIQLRQYGKKVLIVLTDEALEVLKSANVPEPVMAKLSHLKNKKFSREDMTSEIAKVLSKDETKQFQRLILVYAGKKDPDTTKDREELIALWREAVKANPTQAWAQRHLAQSLQAAGDRDGAILAFKEAIRLDPTQQLTYFSLGLLLRTKGDQDAILSLWREAMKANPTSEWTHRQLAEAYRTNGNTDEAIAVWRETVKTNPTREWAYSGLAAALQEKGNLDGAISVWREAILLGPDGLKQSAYAGLTSALRLKGNLDGELAAWQEAVAADSTQSWAHSGLAFALRDRGNIEGAIAAWREAVRLEPRSARTIDLGLALRDRGDLDGAEKEFRELVRLNPYDHWAAANLGNVLSMKGEYVGAVTAYREALRWIRTADQKQTVAKFRWELAAVLWAKGDRDEAIVEFRAAVAADSRSAEAHARLGTALLELGDLNRAIPSLREAVRWGLGNAEYTQKLKQAESWRILLPRLGDIAAGRAEPKNPSEACEFAILAVQLFQRRYGLATRLYAGAFAADPNLAANPDSVHLYNAACAAAQAGCGQGTDYPQKAEDRIAMRAQALAWLKSNLALRRKQAISSSVSEKKIAAENLSWWLRDSDLTGTRPGLSRIGMPASERAQWDRLWADVKATLAEAQKPPPSPEVAPPPRTAKR